MVCQGGCDNSDSGCSSGKRMGWLRAKITNYIRKRHWIRDMKKKFPCNWKRIVERELRITERLRVK